MEFRSVGKPKRGQNAPQEKNIQVVVRCRPRNVIEKRSGSLSAVECHSRKGEVLVRQEVGEKTTTKTFTFDKVYGAESRQIDVYCGVVEPLIEEVLMGYNCTVFAYGQTGTGKTYTMEGERSADGSLSWEEDPLAGIIPRALHELFEKIEAQDVSEFSIRVSFLELYNEELFDLLSPIEDPATKLRIFEDSARKGSVVIHGLEELQVHSKNEVFSILERGRAKRQTASTLLNAQSSRSHSVFSVTVHIKENSIEGEELLKTGKLNLVDLAGSENISRSGAVDKRAREAGQINQSLLTLGRVITSLVERAPHVPYRESKLTRILQDSLGGRTKTSIIATIGPAACNLEETLSTLDYAHRAKNITNRPEINQRLTKKALIKEYTDEIERLKRDLLATREKNGVFISPENYAGMETLIRSQKDAMAELEARIASNQEEICKLNTLFANSKAELEETAQRLEQTSYRLVTTKEHLVTTRRDLHQTRVERDQKNFLVEEHTRTEQALLGQAGDLIEVVEDAIGDVSGLHSKLDRKTRVEATNSATTQRFQKAVEGEFDQMRSNLEEFHSTQQKFCDTFSEGIEMWCSEQLGIIQSLQQAVESVANTFQLFHQSHSSTAGEQTATAQEMVAQSKASTKHFQASLTSISDDMMSSSLLPLLGHLGNQLALQSSSLSQSAANLKSQLHSHEEFVSQFVCDQTQKVENLNATIQRENCKQQAIMSGQQEAIAAALESQRALSKSLQASVMAEVGCLLERVMSQQQEQLVANMALVSMGMRKAAQSQQSHTDHMHREFSVLGSDLSTFGNSCERSTAGTMANVDTMLAEYNTAAEEQDQSAQKMRTELEKGVSAMKQMAERHADEHCSGLEDISTTLASHAHQAEQAIEAQVSTASQSCSTLHSSLHSLATAGVSQPASQWSESTAKVSSALDQFVGSQGQAIGRAGKTVTSYISEELKVDLPTGQTPQRRDFSYPQQLAKTRPHSDLLRDFQPSATLPELPESDTEDEPGADTVSPSLPVLNLSQDSSELETTTTSVDSSVSKISVSELQGAGEEQGKKENNLSTQTPALSKIPVKKKCISGGGKSSSGKKRPLTVKN